MLERRSSFYDCNVPFTAGRKPLVIGPGVKIALLLAAALCAVPVPSWGGSPAGEVG